MEGCEECSTESHIVGIFSTKAKAKIAYEKHLEYKHLHYANVDIQEMNIDEYKPHCGEDVK